ncbi:exopolysaccharide biosynthesis polyprenyl glycosylphosphotransferase [Egicoccus halophilus]|uniref:exopolysaccharide biosynthesis polyprenyl glycosylphosphotransferase n=1 Tax=Egicoccus halophilus TaxID=1670830 RepID=UPI0010302950|nr:exopolysaccharide biosynthesis polyprenyl glycosylphosphotransferase [Egicoccus halophilus]
MHDDPRLLARLNARGFRLSMLLDAVALYALMVGAMLVRFTFEGRPWQTYSVPHYLLSFGVLLAVFLACLYFGGLYEREPRLGAPPTLPRAVRQTLAAAGLFVLLNLVVTGFAQQLGLVSRARVVLPIPTPNLLFLLVAGAVAVAANRWIVSLVRTRREGPPKILLAGTEADLEIARRHVTIDPRRSQIVVEVSDPARILPAVRHRDVTDVVVVTSRWLDELYPRAVQQLDDAGVTMLLRVTGRETMFGLERLREVGGLPFVLLRPQTMPRSRRHFKRLFDLTTLAISAPALLLLTGIIALYQLAVAGRPLLYWQERVGAGGRRFRMVKFRTMRTDAEAEGGARLAVEDDPRVIPACAWVRATRMDELPQLWNVLRGEMSLVGPRPERPELTARFESVIPGYARRHALPPGLTGLAQIHGRYHTDPEYKLGYDLQYLVNWSPVADIEILLRTVWVVLARRL